MTEQANNAPRRAPVKTKRIELEGDYAGWWFEMRTSFPWGFVRNLVNMDTADILAAAITSWNFVDEQGETLPEPYGNPDAFDKVDFDIIKRFDDELAKIIHGAKAESVGDLKNSGGSSSGT